MESNRVPPYHSGCHCGWGQCSARNRASEMKLLSKDAHLSSYLALKYGFTSIAAYRKTSRKSSRISFRWESLSGNFKSVGLVFDFARVAVAPLQALETPLADDAGPVQQVPREQPQNRDAVDRALDERRRRGLFEIPGGHRHLGDPHLDVDQLRHDFLVEDELVGVHRQVHGFQRLAVESPVAGMVFGKFEAEHIVFGSRKKAVGDVLPPGHSFFLGVRANKAIHAVVEVHLQPLSDD